MNKDELRAQMRQARRALSEQAQREAAQAAAAHISPRQIDIQALRDALRRQGAFLG